MHYFFFLNTHLTEGLVQRDGGVAYAQHSSNDGGHVDSHLAVPIFQFRSTAGVSPSTDGAAAACEIARDQAKHSFQRIVKI